LRRKPRAPAQVEPPAWYRTFDLAAWDEPDAHEEAMQAGNLGMPWPDELHRIHAERRWAQAKYQYRRENPALAEQEFKAIVAGERRAREREHP
jgi:hypothetical protein